jgi:predicted nucleotidyltransferase
MGDESAIDEGRQAILDALERHEVRYVVIGGAAAQARGWQEPTDDIDVTPEPSEDNLTRLAVAVVELDAGFRVDPVRYPEGYRPPDGIDARTFRNQVSITFTTRHGDFDVVLIPDGTRGYEEIIATATPETVPGTRVVVPVASAETILHSKAAAGRAKDRAVIDSMRRVLDLED